MEIESRFDIKDDMSSKEVAKIGAKEIKIEERIEIIITIIKGSENKEK